MSDKEESKANTLEGNQQALEGQMYTNLKVDFPKEAYGEIRRGKLSLTSIKAQYVSDRLNEVFGIFGWEFNGVPTISDKGVLIDGSLRVQIGKKIRQVRQYGFAEHSIKMKNGEVMDKNVGDVYKSASTDSLTKCASMIGVGDSVFKGKVKMYGGQASGVNQTSPTGEYRFKTGKNQGKSLSEITDKDLQSILDWSESPEFLKTLANTEFIKRKG